MLQIKTIYDTGLAELDKKVNEFLKDIPEDNVRSIELHDNCMLIQYVIEEEWEKSLCCDCQFWDDSGDSGSPVAFCQIRGQRRRFNCRACENYKDIRR